MLATLGGGTLVQGLGASTKTAQPPEVADAEQPVPAPARESVEPAADVDEVAGSEGVDTGVEPAELDEVDDEPDDEQLQDTSDEVVATRR